MVASPSPDTITDPVGHDPVGGRYRRSHLPDGDPAGDLDLQMEICERKQLKRGRPVDEPRLHDNGRLRVKAKGFWRYETVLIGLLSLNFGVVFFDRNAMSYLGPFVQKDLGLADSQIGLIASAFSVAWGLSGFLGGSLVDRFGHRKLFLVTATLVFSLCSLISGIASSFILLLLARMAMGLFEGADEPDPPILRGCRIRAGTAGLNMGFAQNFGSNLFGSFIAPLVIVALASAYGWRHAFLVSALPGLVMAALIFLILREPKIERVPGEPAPERMPMSEMLRHRNIWLSMVISLFLVPWMVLGWTFLPLLYANVRHFDSDTSSC